MKSLINLIIVCSLCIAGFVQAQSVDLALAREDMRTNKMMLMGQAMSLSDAQGEIFWPIYRAYQNEVDLIYDARFKGIQEYANHYDNMTEEKAAELAKLFFKLNMQRWKLREKYYKRIAKALNPILGVRFAQADQQLATLVDVQLMAMVPLIASPEELLLGEPPIGN